MAQELQNGDAPRSTTPATGGLEIKCGPLLNYKRMSNPNSEQPTWHGSVLYVTNTGQQAPGLELKCAGFTQNTTNGQPDSATSSRSFQADKLYEDSRCGFWRYSIDLPLQSHEARWEYSTRWTGSDASKSYTFVVPSATESMRIMFHSCNGFSVGTDVDAWSGCALWNDVLRKHETLPIHVMIGGGDQIYNDGIRVDGPLRPWTDISNPHKRREFPFDDNLRAACDDYYLKNYLRWYSTAPFSDANSIIPQVNIWDDHDIIDGFGSYTDHFMRCAVFRGIGAVAYKYYLLFQHHVAPPQTTFTTAKSEKLEGIGSHTHPSKLDEAYIMTEKEHDPSFIFGKNPGPYVEERSRSLYCQLGAHIAFMGIDARTERTRHQINYEETYDLLFRHASKQIADSQGRIKHFILLLGVPIAYPRLQWLENILTSPIIGPIRFLSKRFGLGGGLFNNFDGNVDLLDDLDDHYTAHQHKRERRNLIHRIQTLAKEHNVRVTILGGDVHLAAMGRFYSNPRLNVPTRQDHRYIANIVSSAITNKPPPQAVANLLARRNKIHHLDDDTDETLLNLFDKDPGLDEHPDVEKKTSDKNHCTMPSRNFALITESHDHTEIANGTNDTVQDYDTSNLAHHRFSQKSGNPRDPMHPGEANCGTQHPASSGTTRTGLGGRYGLDVSICVEISPKDSSGKTQGYGFTIPTLELAPAKAA